MMMATGVAMTRDEQYLVCLYGGSIGRIFRRGDFTRFVFDKDYLANPTRAVLGLRFEENLSGSNSANMRLPPWFSNLLPEGRLREWIGQARGVSIDREMQLLAQVGHDLPGAVRVLPTDSQGSADVDGAVGLSDVADPRPEGLWRFSLAGVGLKFSMLARGDRFTAPASGEGGDWIVKLPDPDYAEVPRNEFAMMQVARASGIDTPEVKLVHRDQIPEVPDGLWHREVVGYAIRRFDRLDGGGLLHIEDLAQVRGFYPDMKYAGSFETVASLIYRRHDVGSLREFARRLAFNILIGNGDAHLKNWSLIYRDPRVPTLSPAYDIVATSVYRPENFGAEDLGLKFNGTRRFEAIRLSDFDALDRKLGSRAGLADVVAAFVTRVIANWPLAEEALRDQDDLRSRVGARILTYAARLR